MPTKQLPTRILDAETRCNKWLADGNAAAERGDQTKAQACYQRSQFWLDRFNGLAGRGSRPAPKQ